MAFIDLHSHILPGLDDGAPNPEISLAMVKGLAAAGFSTICATPHQKEGQFLPSLHDIHNAHTHLSESVAKAGVEVDIILAAENMWDNVFYERTKQNSVPSYDGGPSFLFELPIARTLPVGLFEELFRVTRTGSLPVLAHPERYEPLWSDPALVDKLSAHCALVVDLAALVGYHGRKRAKMSRKLVKAGKAHAVASDAHTPQDVRSAVEGIAWIEKKLGASVVERLLSTHPRAILAGQHPGL